MHFVAIPLGEACATRRSRSQRRDGAGSRSAHAVRPAAESPKSLAREPESAVPVTAEESLAAARQIKTEIAELLDASDLARIQTSLVAILDRVQACLARLDVALVPDPTDRIIAAVCLRFRVTVEEIKGHSRPDRIAFPRQVAMFLMRHFGMPYEAVRLAVGAKSHGTAMHAVDAVRARMECEPVVRKAIVELATKLGIDISTR
jgi:chromosomal replication initiation ATPase DnaA